MAENPEGPLRRTFTTKQPKKPYVKMTKQIRRSLFTSSKNIKDENVFTGQTFKLKSDISDGDTDVFMKINDEDFSGDKNDVKVVSDITQKALKLTNDVSELDVSHIGETFTKSSNGLNVSHITGTSNLTEYTNYVDNVRNATSKAYQMPELGSKNTSRVATKVPQSKQLCDYPLDAGSISVNTLNITMEDVMKKYPEVRFKGRYTPHDCWPRQSVAIIVPYRDRKKNLVAFLDHMHGFLIQQKVDYGIFIVEQKGMREFNRGKLFNVGFLEAGTWQCFIFHDIDLLPLDLRNFYSCDPEHPRVYDAFEMLYGHAQNRDDFNGNFGGVTVVTARQFKKANGYSNGYWGWGGEDNDLYYRLQASGYIVVQYNRQIARYTAIEHEQKSSNPKRHRTYVQTMKAYHMDGLSTVHYSLESTTYHRLYTHIVVDVDESFHELQDLFQEKIKFQQLYEDHNEFFKPVLRKHLRS